MQKKKYKHENATFSPKVEKEIANICLICPLPVKKCRPAVCKRFKAEFKRLSSGGKYGE